MKQFFILFWCFVGSLCVHADDVTYPYLVFETTDGTAIAIPVSSLTLSIADGKLTAGDKTFTLTDLSKMYFSDSATTGITETGTHVNAPVHIYATDGTYVGTFGNVRQAESTLKHGIYIIKSEKETHKTVIP